MKRSLHEEIGGLDESFSSLDDTDYCWRIQLRGTELHFVENAVLRYRYRDKIKDIFRQSLEYAEENVLIYKKYLALGMTRLSWKESLSSWKQMIKRLLRVRDKGDFANFIWLAGVLED